ncbi:RNA-directed DNA polymerase, eukaryota [Tanacetum coccineum]
MYAMTSCLQAPFFVQAPFGGVTSFESVTVMASQVVVTSLLVTSNSVAVDPDTVSTCNTYYTFPNRLSSDQLDMLESPISRDEVRNAVWGCGENKSPRPDGFTFEFFQKFWDTLGSDFCAAVEWFFDHSSFSRGCNSSFIALISENHDPKFVNEFRPIIFDRESFNKVPKSFYKRLMSIRRNIFMVFNATRGKSEEQMGQVWIGDTQLRVMFPRIYALEINKDCTVADKLQFSVTSSLRRSVRGGVESSQLALLQTYIEGTLLSNMEDRWVWDLNGEGVFRVKDVRILLDECFLPKAPTATRWVKYVPIKINVFAWKVFLDRLPTRSNLQHRGVLVFDYLCPLCSSAQEDSSHLFFSCRLATDIVRLVCRWWNLSWTPLGSYANWLNWFNSIRLSSKVKDLLEGVLYIT